MRKMMSIPANVFPVLLLLSTNLDVVSATSCPPEDALSCARGGYCTMGGKDYQALLGTSSSADVGLIETSKRGMHCTCPDDLTQKLVGFSGVQCDTPFERCEDDSVCFNGGYCEQDSYDYERYHCSCPKGQGDGNIYTGRACELKATDVCTSFGDTFYDVVGSRWFCANGGECLDYATDASIKCDCPYGLTGPHCEYSEYDYEECLLQCYNGGICKKGAKDLTKFVDSGMDIDAFLGGTNLEGEHCACPDGFTGIQCNITNVMHCGDGVCFNGGFCVERIKEDGTIMDKFCECDNFNSMMGGEFCEHRDVTFCPAPVGHDPSLYYCANGGICPSEAHEPCLYCNQGWTGSRCETQVVYEGNVQTDNNECDLKCQNGGKCFFSEETFEYSTAIMEQISPALRFLFDNKHCKCRSGYVGLVCELKIIPRVGSMNSVTTSGGVAVGRLFMSLTCTIIVGITVLIIL